MADLHQHDPVADANKAIRQFIRDIGGRIHTSEQRAQYEALVDTYFAAIRERDQADEPEPARLAA